MGSRPFRTEQTAGGRAPALPALDETVARILGSAKPAVADVLRQARQKGTAAIQPRCGVGAHDEMLGLLTALEHGARPDILTVTIDSHTRLMQFGMALRALNSDARTLNGYPLVTHGWSRGRELNDAVEAPLQIRHGSPDPRRLFDVSIAAGILSFEGGGIGYNLPYSKDVPLSDSLSSWQYVDEVCGDLARRGVVVDRELFGTLTAVLVPPSVSLSVTILEAWLAAREGVRCISIAYPQGGELIQDVAALRSIDQLARRYLPGDAEVYPVLHEFMGVFPRDRARAEALIFYGALTGRLGNAAKIVTKTHQEAFGIPDVPANIEGIRTSRLAQSPLLDFITVDEERLAEEMYWIQQEVADIVEPVLASGNVPEAIAESFSAGTLDIPFSASRHARSAVIPRRDPRGAIRYLDHGALPLSGPTLRRNSQMLGQSGDAAEALEAMLEDINYFATQSGHVASSAALESA